jgi:glyoxylase-like metal-dependent hydrolase (beta-lactamase superfamily II)
MKRAVLCALAILAVTSIRGANAQPLIDWDKIQIKTTDLGNRTYMLEGRGGNITVAVGDEGILMVDGQFAPLSDRIKAAIRAISPLPIKYLINTHYHGDHTGGNENFAKEGVTIVAHDNVRVRLAAGTTSGLTGKTYMTPRQGAVPTQTYFGGSLTLDIGGRKVRLTHAANAHTDGDTWVYFEDANVLSTGDTLNTQRRYQLIDFANGGDVRGMIRANAAYLGISNENTKVVPGHGGLGNRATIIEYHAMLVTARERIEKLYRAGMTENEVIALRPMRDYDAVWGPNDASAICFVRNVYNSFGRL